MIVGLDSQGRPAASTTCSHCGADLLGAGLTGSRDTERFCCEGCRVVHGILAGAEGGVYYDLLEQSNAKAPRGGLSPSYRTWLDGLRDPETLRRIGRWEGGTHSLTLECSDMQCAACGWLMERVLGQTPGVLDYEVDFVHGEMHVRYDAGKTLLPEVLESVGRYGYPFKPKAAFAAKGGPSGRTALDRSAWMRLAVAAACFMNAMAFAFGPYLGFSRGMSPEWTRALGLWTFLSALPAVFYSAYPFYLGAWRALRGRAFTIDVTVTIGIILAFTVSLASVISDLRGGHVGLGHFNYADTLAGLVFFLLLGRYAVRRFEGGLMLRNRWHEALSPDVVRVRDEDAPDGVRWTPLDQVAAGDLVEIGAGDYLPVDGVVEAGTGSVDTAFLTGEDRPRPFVPGDFLFAGWRVLGGGSGAVPLRLRVANPHAKTRAAGLRRSLESLVARKRSRNIRRERVALGFTLVVAASALTAFAVHWSSGWEKAFVTAAAVFIVSCSCALALAVPVSRGVGLLRAHRLGFHFRDQETLERLAATRAVLFDKTGTLTFTRRRLERWEWVASFAADAATRERVLAATARLSGMSSHPVAMALHAALTEKRGTADVGNINGFVERPHFGLTGDWSAADSGASLRLCVCRYDAWSRNPEEFRALGMTEPSVGDLPSGDDPAPQSCLFVNGRLAALAMLGEETKPGARDLLKGLKALAMPSCLLSGDHPDRVASFARNAGFEAWRGGLSPEQKQVEARAFQEQHGAALAVGDGYNDSLLFGEASVSLAVQGAAGPVAAEADAFMTASDPAAILSLLRIAEGTRRSLRNCYVVSGVYNTGAISLAVAGFVSPLTAAILMPIASLSLVLTAWVTIPKK